MIGFQDEGGGSTVGPNPGTVTANVFSEGGLLEQALRLEHRPQQESMALAVTASLHRDAPLLFEAGTGVGKSLAYLLPSLMRAIDHERQCLVSTATISLQEQLLYKDIPLCRSLFKEVSELNPYADFRATLLVGKSNYLCRTRLSQAVSTQGELFASAEQQELERIIEWANTTDDGLRQELTPPPLHQVWEWVNADSSVCNRRNCSPDDCFYQKARARLQKAHLIIINHSLLFALIGAGASSGFKPPGILFPKDFAILDEAHTVPSIATEHFGLRLSSYGIDRLLKALFNPRTKRGLVTRYGRAEHQQAVIDALEAAEAFFSFIRQRLLDRRAEVRLREADWCDPVLGPPLKKLIEITGNLADRMEEGPARSEVLDQKGKLQSYYSAQNEVLSLAQDDHVYWVERSGQKGQVVTLRSAPLDVAPYLREHLFARETAVVLTSATLSTAGSMENYQQQVGAEGFETAIVDSPFDYENHLRAYVARDIPLPSRQDAKLAIDALADYILFAVQRVEQGSLVLFTSYADMQKTADLVEDSLAKMERPLLVQGQQYSRTDAVKVFKKAGNAVLFGTDSFWTGVDVPGPALSQVIVTRLPFENPTHPIAEAKCEWIRDQGRQPFFEYTLPDALIKFRQGIGRLIRTREDRGILLILDSRVLSKTYGKLFVRCLPVRQFEPLTRENREERFRFPDGV